MNLIVPEIRESRWPARNRRLGSLNRVLTAFQEFTRGYFGRRRIFRWLLASKLAIGRRARRGKIFQLDFPPVRSTCAGEVGRIKGEIFGEKELKGGQLGSRRTGDRHVSLYVISRAAGLSLYPGHKAATSIPWNA